jgi:hypothetical protein
MGIAVGVVSSRAPRLSRRRPFCSLPRSIEATARRFLPGRSLSPQTRALADTDPVRGRASCEALAKQLERDHPDAVASLREGLDEMFTVARLGIAGRVRQSLTNTNCIEPMISIYRTNERDPVSWTTEDIARPGGAGEDRRGCRRRPARGRGMRLGCLRGRRSVGRPCPARCRRACHDLLGVRVSSSTARSG